MSTPGNRSGGFVVLDEDGAVLFATDEARRMLNRDELVGLELGIPITVDGFTRVDVIGQEGPVTLTVTTVEGEWQGKDALIAVLHEDLDDRAPDDDWISVAGHEMNNPLSVIMGYAETLDDHLETLGEAQIRRAVNGIERQAVRLQRLVARLLTHSRANAGLVDTAAEPVAVTELQETLVHDFGGGLQIDIDDDAIAVVDRAHLLLALENLIENATRYGEPPIEVSARLEGDVVRLTVRDHGDGVGDDFEDRLFEAFQRGSGGRKASGIGLGLSIVKRLIDANSGTIEYRTPEDGGAQFVIELPAAKGEQDVD